MAYIMKQVDKGLCLSCFGTGWDETFKKQQSLMIDVRRSPNAFDLNKCPKCKGSGRTIEYK